VFTISQNGCDAGSAAAPSVDETCSKGERIAGKKGKEVVNAGEPGRTLKGHFSRVGINRAGRVEIGAGLKRNRSTRPCRVAGVVLDDDVVSGQDSDNAAGLDCWKI